jgi:hypothetical protein
MPSSNLPESAAINSNATHLLTARKAPVSARSRQPAVSASCAKPLEPSASITRCCVSYEEQASMRGRGWMILALAILPWIVIYAIYLLVTGGAG